MDWQNRGELGANLFFMLIPTFLVQLLTAFVDLIDPIWQRNHSIEYLALSRQNNLPVKKCIYKLTPL